MGVTYEYEGVRRSIRALQQRIENPGPTLKHFSKKIIADVKANIAAGGSGWPPYAESTIEHMEHRGTGQITRRGTVRVDRLRRASKTLQRIEAQVRQHGWTDKLRERYDRVTKRIAAFKKAEARAQKKSAGERNIGPRQSEKRRLLQRMPGTIRSKLLPGNVLMIYSRAGKVGYIQNKGEGRTPKREFLPPPNMDQSLDYLAQLLEADWGQAWDNQ